MAQSLELALMKKALSEQVFPMLRNAGFKGSYPHFRRITADKVDLLSFMSPGDAGCGFCAGATVIFPNAESRQKTNLFYPKDDTPVQKMNFAHGRIRCSLPGMFGGAFYYTDLYARDYEARGNAGATYFPWSEKMAAASPNIDPTGNGFILIQKADEGIYGRIAAENARQMPDLLEWFDLMQCPADLHQYRASGKRCTIPTFSVTLIPRAIIIVRRFSKERANETYKAAEMGDLLFSNRHSDSSFLHAWS